MAPSISATKSSDSTLVNIPTPSASPPKNSSSATHQAATPGIGMPSWVKKPVTAGWPITKSFEQP